MERTSQSSERAPSGQAKAVRGDHIRGLAGKYLVFKLARECYGVEILSVREIIGMMDITRVPRTEEHVAGVINLRGKVVTVVDLRRKFAMTPTEVTDQTAIIVVQYMADTLDVTVGMLVDEVVEVIDIDEESIDPPPSFGPATGEADFIVGVGKTPTELIFLLDVAQALRRRGSLQIEGTAET